MPETTRACAAECRETMTYQAERGELAAWYSHIDAAAQLNEYRDVLDSSTRKRVRKTIDKSCARDSLQALSKLTTLVDGQPRIVSTPPLIVPGADPATARLPRHSAALPTCHVRPIRVRADGTESRRGGSVGTGAWIILLRGPGGRCSRRPRRRNRRSSPDTWTARRSRTRANAS